MPKKRGEKNSKPSVKDHIKHKTRLTALLVIKVLLAFVCLGLAIIAYSFINDIFSQTISLILLLVIAIVLYLFLFIKILSHFKF